MPIIPRNIVIDVIPAFLHKFDILTLLTTLLHSPYFLSQSHFHPTHVLLGDHLHPDHLTYSTSGSIYRQVLIAPLLGIIELNVLCRYCLCLDRLTTWISSFRAVPFLHLLHFGRLACLSSASNSFIKYNLGDLITRFHKSTQYFWTFLPIQWT